MSVETGAIEIVTADFAAFSRALEKVMGAEIESFQGLSGQYGLFEDMDALLKRLLALNSSISARLSSMVAADACEISRDVRLMDALLEQLNRLVVVADLRGATLTSGDLLKKLQGWVSTLRDWLSGILRQLAEISASA